MQTATIEIPLKLKEEIESIAQEKGENFKQCILNLIYGGIENLDEESLKDKIDQALASGFLGEQESLELLNELKS